MDPQPNDQCPCKKRRDTGTQRDDSQATMTAETKMMRPQAQEDRGLPAATSSRETGLEPPSEPHREPAPQTPSSRTSGLQTERQEMLAVLSQVCGHLLLQPQDTNMGERGSEEAHLPKT